MVEMKTLTIGDNTYEVVDDKARKDIEELQKSVGSTDVSVPSYWQTALEEGAKAINEAMLNVGSNKSAFLFYSDAHWTSNSKSSPALLKYLYNNTAMNKVFFGGDIVDLEENNYDTMKYLWEWRKQLKGLPNHHSVVGNHDDGNSTNNLFSEQYVYGFLLSAEETPDMIRGNSGLYYYIDSPAERTRYLFLDTAYKGMDSVQLEFIKEALISTKENWHIVAIAHIWYDPDYDGYYNQGVRPMQILGMNSGAAKAVALFDDYNSRSGDYADCKGWVEFCIGGHAHIDYDGTSSTGIPIILVETDSSHIRSNLNYQLGTYLESSVNGIIADYTNHKIRVIRIGRGSSRNITVENYIINYTNVLDTVGWTENKRVSVSEGYIEKDNTGTDLSGFIPCTAGDVIRMRNVIFPSTATSYEGTVFYYTASKSGIGSCTANFMTTHGTDKYRVSVDSAGNLIQFTLPNDTGETIGYIRICASNIDATSIITVNEEIDFVEDDEDDGSSTSYMNALKSSTELDGSLYNEGQGWKANTRLNSSGVEASYDGVEVTGFIPIKVGETIRWKNIKMDIAVDAPYNQQQYLAFYDSNKNKISSTLITGFKTFFNQEYYGRLDENNSPTYLYLGDWFVNAIPEWNSEYTAYDVAYFRFSAEEITNSSIVTINEEIA